MVHSVAWGDSRWNEHEEPVVAVLAEIEDRRAVASLSQ